MYCPALGYLRLCKGTKLGFSFSITMSETKKGKVSRGERADDKATKKGSGSGHASSKSSEDVLKTKSPNAEDLAAVVTSVNDWEHADLGDNNRKNKFLRLMGAAKVDNKVAVGDKPVVKFVTDNHKVAEELEEQFKESLEHSLVGGHKGHIGLGFHESLAPTEKVPLNKKTYFDDDATVVGRPNNDIAGPNRVEEYSDDDDGSADREAGEITKAVSKVRSKGEHKKAAVEKETCSKATEESEEVPPRKKVKAPDTDQANAKADKAARKADKLKLSFVKASDS